MNFLNTLKVLSNHPLTKRKKLWAFRTYFKYRLLHKLLPHPFIYTSPFFNERAKFIIKDIQQYQIIYTKGLPEFYELCFLIHFLRPGDVFIDVGANKGLFSIIATGFCGADSIVFEPVPATFNDLQENIRLNDLSDKVTMVNAGVGMRAGTAHFSTNRGSANSVVSKEDEASENVVAVKICSLDEVIPSPSPAPVLLKIDVEGYEFEVLKGAAELLKNPAVKAIIIELNGAAKKYNYKEEDIHQHLCSLGFRPYRYFPLTRQCMLQESYKSFIDKDYMSDNTIYIRDQEFTTERTKTASFIKSGEVSI